MDKELPHLISRLTFADFQELKKGKRLPILSQCGVLLCQKGNVELKANDNIFQFNTGDLFIFTSSVNIRIIDAEPETIVLAVAVDLEYILLSTNQIMNIESVLYIRNNPCVSLNANQFNHLTQLIEQLLQRTATYESNKNQGTEIYQYLQKQIVRSQVLTVTYEVLSCYYSCQHMLSLQTSKKDIVFQNFIAALYKNYKQERDVTFYAKQQNLTPRYFSTLIKEKTGINALQWITKMVMAEAKNQLGTSDKSIKEIAKSLNFPTQSFFGKYFKQYSGMSPKEYRMLYHTK